MSGWAWLVGVLFVVLKDFGVIGWTWVWVLSPFGVAFLILSFHGVVTTRGAPTQLAGTLITDAIVVAGLLFIVLKLDGNIDWSWFWLVVLLPSIGVGLAVIVGGIFFLIGRRERMTALPD